MKSRKSLWLAGVIMLLVAMMLSGCNQGPTGNGGTVIEPGLNGLIEQGTDGNSGENDDPVEVDPFPDKGSDATVEDLIAAQAKIESFYVEQSMNYQDGSVFVQVWYKDGKMKLISSYNGYAVSESYYDYVEKTQVSLTPGSTSAVMTDFDETSIDAPDNPIKDDYSTFTVVGGEMIGRQYCMMMQTPEGDLLWVGTKYAFPLRMEYTDSLGEWMSADYRNIQINTVTDADVAMPEGLDIHYYGVNGDAELPGADIAADPAAGM